jgi:ABC-type amino acid transport substrate-binding protein
VKRTKTRFGKNLKTWTRSLVVWLLTGLVSVASLGSANAQDLDLTESEQAWIKGHPVIRVHNETDWPPYNFNVDGEPSGFSIDYMRLLAEQAGLDVEFVSGPSWNEFLDMMRTGDLDVMLNIVDTPARREYLLFTSPYAITSPVLAVQEQVTDLNSLNDLAGRSVCLPRGSSGEEFMRQRYPDVDILSLSDATACLHAVADGRAFASLEGFSVLNHLLEASRLPGLRIANIAIDPDMASVMGIATNIDQPILRDILQKAMDRLEASAVADVRQQWLGVAKVVNTVIKLTEEELQWIADNPIIRVHNEAEFAPFNFNVDGEPRGFSIDYINLVASKVGLQTQFLSGPSWQEFLDMIRAGDLDVMINIIPTPEREEYIAFTSTYFQTPAAIVVQDSALQISSLDDLRGRRVAVTEGYFHQRYFEQEYPDVELVLEGGYLQALFAVLEGRADAMIASYTSVNYLIGEHNLAGLQVAFISQIPELTSSNSIGVPLDKPILRDILQKGMDAVDESELATLRSTWLGQQAAPVVRKVQVALTPAERDWLAEHPVIRMGVDPEGVTYDFVDEQGRHQGFTADMLALILPRVGVNVKLVPGLTWKQVIDGVENRSVDMASLCSRTPEREAFMVFTNPLTSIHRVAVTRQSDPRITSLDDIGERRLFIESGQSVIEIVRTSNPEIAITEVDSALAGLEAVSVGQADVFIGSLGLVAKGIRSNSLLNLRVGRVAEIPASPQQTCIRSDWPELAGILNKGLATITEQERRAIEQKWIPISLSDDTAEDHTLTQTVTWLIGITLSIFLILFLLNRVITVSAYKPARCASAFS